MDNDALKTWIEEVDRAYAAPSQASDDLAGRVRMIARRRRRLQGTLAGIAALGVITGLMVWSPTRPRPGAPGHDDAKANVRAVAELDALRDRIAMGEARLEALLAADESRRRQDADQAQLAVSVRQVGRPEPMEIAAMILIHEAQRAEQYQQIAAAAEDYRRVIAHFPDTRSAEAARHHLARLDGRDPPQP